jgi:DNA mismatch repair protein MutL
MLWLDMDSRKIDVNVHPTKREIRLANQAQVTAAIEACVRDSLRMPDAQSFVYDSQASNFRPAKIGESSQLDLNSSIEFNPSKEESNVVRAINTLPDQLSFSLIAPSAVPKGDSSAQHIDASILHENPKIWQIHGQYILVQIDDGLLLVTNKRRMKG